MVAATPSRREGCAFPGYAPGSSLTCETGNSLTGVQVLPVANKGSLPQQCKEDMTPLSVGATRARPGLLGTMQVRGRMGRQASHLQARVGDLLIPVLRRPIVPALPALRDVRKGCAPPQTGSAKKLLQGIWWVLHCLARCVPHLAAPKQSSCYQDYGGGNAQTFTPFGQAARRANVGPTVLQCSKENLVSQTLRVRRPRERGSGGAYSSVQRGPFGSPLSMVVANPDKRSMSCLISAVVSTPAEF